MDFLCGSVASGAFLDRLSPNPLRLLMSPLNARVSESREPTQCTEPPVVWLSRLFRLPFRDRHGRQSLSRRSSSAPNYNYR